MSKFIAIMSDGKYYARVVSSAAYDSLVIGVCDNGTRSANGWGLKWIGEDFNTIENLPSNYFDKHPSWNFSFEGDDYANIFCKIPIAYWKRGTVPSGPNTGKWYMMISPAPKEGFTANSAFMYKGVQKDAFYWGAYRAFDNNNKPGSRPDKSHWKNVSWSSFWNAAVSLGDGYHMGSFQEYHEILARAVIEKKTFDLWPQAVRRDYQANEYRGIQEMAYDSYTDDSTNGTYAEWRSGVRIDANKNLIVFDTAGNWTYVNSGKATNINGFIGTLLTGQYFDHIFFAETVAFTFVATMIPNKNYTGRSSSVGYSAFNTNTTGMNEGAFCSLLSYSVSSAYSNVSSRLAYINPDGDNV